MRNKRRLGGPGTLSCQHSSELQSYECDIDSFCWLASHIWLFNAALIFSLKKVIKLNKGRNLVPTFCRCVFPSLASIEYLLCAKDFIYTEQLHAPKWHMMSVLLLSLLQKRENPGWTGHSDLPKNWFQNIDCKWTERNPCTSKSGVYEIKEAKQAAFLICFPVTFYVSKEELQCAAFPKLAELVSLTSTACGMQPIANYFFSSHLSAVFSGEICFPSPWMKIDKLDFLVIQ